MTPSTTEVPSLPRLNGLTFSGLLITELFGNVSGGTQRTVIWESLSILGMHFDFEKAVHFPGLSLNVSGLYCAGYGLTDKAVHDLNVLSNIDSYDSLRLYEAWLQQDFANGQFSIRAGQLPLGFFEYGQDMSAFGLFKRLTRRNTWRRGKTLEIRYGNVENIA